MGRVLGNISEPDQPDAECAIRLTFPEEFAGSSMGEFQSRGGYITGMDVQSGIVILRGSLPAAEFQAFRETIAFVTQQRGSVERE
jgi:translation elongation factor EF-G